MSTRPLSSAEAFQAMEDHWVNEALTTHADPERLAYCYLQLGLLMEWRHDFASAIDWYSKGHSVEPLNAFVCYFLNNNLGYSLNQLRRFAEAEPYCRAAITIDGHRHNGHKNLGVSLTGQRRYAEASSHFVKAALACPTDQRALQCLERLVAERPELLSQVDSLEDDLNECRNAARWSVSADGG